MIRLTLLALWATSGLLYAVALTPALAGAMDMIGFPSLCVHFIMTVLVLAIAVQRARY